MFWEMAGNSLTGTSLEMWGAMLQTYGYLALLIGTFIEGETVVILSGLSAQMGYLTLTGVWVIAFLGALVGDWIFFYLGRVERHVFLDKRPAWKAQVDHFNDKLLRHKDALIVGRRFFYGFRNLTAFVIGMSPVSVRRFLFLNTLSVFVWTLLYSSLGFFSGRILKPFLRDAETYTGWMMLTLFGVVLVFALVRYLHYKKHHQA